MTHKIRPWVLSAVIALEAVFPTSAQNLETAVLATIGSSALRSSPLAKRPLLASGQTLFEELPASATGVDFQMQFPDIAANIHEIIHLSVYGGICTGDFDADGLTDFYVTSPKGGNRLFRNLGDFRFKDVTEISGVSTPNFWGTGATFVDIDNDGDLDIYACGYQTPNRLYLNEGAGSSGIVRFQERASELGLDYSGGSMMMTFADYDLDGDLDGYLATTAVPPPPGLQFGVIFEDEKPVVPDELKEYWALIYLPDERAHQTEAGQYDHLFKNEGGKFIDVSEVAGIDGPFFTLAAHWWDYNNDGWPDLYIANDYLGPDMLYRNNQNGTFTDVILDSISHTPWSSMGVDSGDINNDGLLDLIATDMLGSTHYRRQVMMGEASKQTWFLTLAEPRQYTRNALYINSGTDRFLEGAYQAGIAATDWTWAPRIEDFDNDGLTDVLFVNGMLRDVQHSDKGMYADRTYVGGSRAWAEHWAAQSLLSEANMAFKNLGNFNFEKVDGEWGFSRVGVSLGLATADFDNDGDLDVVVNNADAPVSVYRNRSSSGNLIRVKLHGNGSNRFGLGAKVSVRTKNSTQIRYLASARGWLSGSEPVLHFGLGDSHTVDELTVEWPGGGKQTFTHLPVNRIYEITERLLVSSSETERPTPLFLGVDQFKDIVRQVSPSSDRDVQQTLIPFDLSESIYCITWGDFDGDGKEDFYLGGNAGEPGRLFVRQSTGEFSVSTQPVLSQDKAFQDTDAEFFDFDNDGDLDLYVSSGGVSIPEGDAIYSDRLYLNEGGLLRPAQEEVLASARSNGNVIASSDFDQDGDIDLFVGGYSIPGKYPLASKSQLLINDGANLSEATPGELEYPGLVTNAVWTDVDGNGWADLLLTTEWGHVRLYENESGILAEKSSDAGLAAWTGWWEAIAAGDIDNDGDLDLVVGNRGRNTRYHASPEEPQVLLYGDFDGSNRVLLIEAYYENGRLFPYQGLNALFNVMPSMSAKFRSYDQFAKASIDEMFDTELLNRAVRKEVNTTESGIFFNDGNANFEFTPLPPLAQIAPVNDIALSDINDDGNLDLVLAQNDFSARPEIGRMAGAISLLLLGDGTGNFQPVRADQSGIVVPEPAQRINIRDLNSDGKPDLIFGIQSQGLKTFLNQSP